MTQLIILPGDKIVFGFDLGVIKTVFETQFVEFIDRFELQRAQFYRVVIGVKLEVFVESRPVDADKLLFTMPKGKTWQIVNDISTSE